MTFKEQLLSASPEDIEKLVDVGIRHRSPRATPFSYLEHWLSVARCFGYATKDDSWGEFEKLFAIMTKRLILAERKNASTPKKT